MTIALDNKKCIIRTYIYVYNDYLNLFKLNLIKLFITIYYYNYSYHSG